MTGLLWGALGILGGFGLAATGDMVSEEVRDRLDHLPHLILRLAAMWLAPEQRVTVYEDEWLPELTYILKGDEARPVTRLLHGTWYAIGIAISTRRITALLRREVPARLTQEEQPRVMVLGEGVLDLAVLGEVAEAVTARRVRETVVRLGPTQAGLLAGTLAHPLGWLARVGAPAEGTATLTLAARFRA